MTGMPRPLPVRPGPRPGETAASYLTLLAAANHMPADWLRIALSPGPQPRMRPDLGLLAAASGRTETALRHALADFSCAWCGTELTAQRRGRTRLWCSQACAFRGFRRARRNSLPPQGRPDPALPGVGPPCRRCGKTFPRRTGRGRPAQWCSSECRRKDYRQRLRAETEKKPARPVPPRYRFLPTAPGLSCGYCGAPIIPQRRGRPRLWCSPACSLQAHRQRLRNEQQRPPRVAVIPGPPCIGCGGPVTRRPLGRPAKWCSPNCAQRHHRQRQRENASRDRSTETTPQRSASRDGITETKTPGQSQLTYLFAGQRNEAG